VRWDQLAARFGLFLSSSVLLILEQHLPENLPAHFAMVNDGRRPVAVVVSQSLEVRAADLSARRIAKLRPGLCELVGKASRHTFSRTRRPLPLHDDLRCISSIGIDALLQMTDDRFILTEPTASRRPLCFVN